MFVVTVTGFTMKSAFFQKIAARLKGGGAFLRGKKKSAYRTTAQSPKDRALRKKLDLTQSQVATLIGISPHTPRDWEQGNRRPRGTARALLRVAESHPEEVLEARHR
jgi:putative transcriptional regulator